MSVFARIAGTEEPKIPVWYIITDFTRMMDNDISMGDLATRYELSQAEIGECVQYMTGLGAMIDAEKAERVRIGMGAEFAEGEARTRVNALMMHLLLRAEQGTITEAQFRQRLGLV